MFDLRENYAVSRKLASQGMVLLKNEDGVLPFGKEDVVGVVGKNCLDLIRGGGSAHVQVEYVRSLQDGLREKAGEGKFSLYEPSLELAEQTDMYTVEQFNELAVHIDTAIVTYKRYGSEGEDRKIGNRKDNGNSEYVYAGEADTGVDDVRGVNANAYYPDRAELALFDMIERSALKNVVLILNISAIVDMTFIERYSKIKAVLLAYLPGMESGTAIADVLCGDVNPGGRLTDTVAYDIYDYSSTANFNAPHEYDHMRNSVVRPNEYKEGIFVGYRYFETFAKDRVMYPFGYGLSYTTFAFDNAVLQADGDALCACVDVTNTGNVAGREVVQIYSAAPKGALEKPAIELRGYHKTKELQPGETEHVCVKLRVADLASFDADGVTGHPAAWVLEAGDYTVYAGQSVRDLYPCGTYTQSQTVVTEQLTARFGGQEYVEELPEVTYHYGGINLAKAVEFAFTDGVDLRSGHQVSIRTGRITSYEEFYTAVKKHIAFMCERCLSYITKIEGYYGEIYPDPLLSAQYDRSVETGVDLYEGGAKYNNSSLSAYSIATLVDSIAAVKRLVFDEERVTFDELSDILKADWQDHEKLRLYARSIPEKYGNNEPVTDEITVELSHYIASLINGKPNGRGGVFKASLFSIDHGFALGKKTMATPDGRHAGESNSKNLCATPAMDKKGITALINSVTKIDQTEFPNGVVLDIVLHPSAVSGEDGLEAFLGILKTYFMMGGMALHGNVFDVHTLRAAQNEPEKYKTLQVRVCGWNAYFVNLSKDEQDAFILQAENTV